MILSGELPEGTRLPPERKLAASLGVNRTTVVNAYRELEALGLVEAHVGRGTTVCHSLAGEQGPSPMPWVGYLPALPQARSDTLLHDLGVLSSKKDLISFATGMAAPDLYPLEEFRAALNAILDRDGRSLLQYCPTEGYGPLRQILAERLTKRGLTVEPGHVLVLAGAQEGLYLVAQALLEPGDLVIVESPTYLGALQVFRAAGARLLGIPMDQEGMQVDRLKEYLMRQRPRLIYTMPSFQNPTGITMSLQRRQRLLSLAQEHHVPILEDDPYGELYYDCEPPVSLKALDRASHVLYLSTASEVLFPGLRLGWLVAPPPVVERLTLIKRWVDLHANTLAQGAVYEFLRQGSLDAHLIRLRQEYARRRDLLLQALERYCARHLSWVKPQGGFHLWCRLSDGLRVRDVAAEALQEGVVLIGGDLFYAHNDGQEEFRLSFSYLPPDLLEEGARRLGKALNRVAARRYAAAKIQEAGLAAQPIL